MSEEAKVRLMVVPIVAMLAVTMMVAGYQQDGEQDIEVEEGYGEMEIEYLPGPDQSETFYDAETDRSSKNATATTSLKDSNSTLKFEVLVESIISTENRQFIHLILSTQGSFEKNSQINKNLFKVKGLDENNGSNYIYDFNLACFEGENIELWSPDEYVSGSAGDSESFIGFDIIKNEFSASCELTWKIPRRHWNENYTIRVESIASGLAQDIVSTVDVNIREEVKV